MKPMDWEQKFEAMKALVGPFDIHLSMRAPGDWYVSANNRGVSDGCVIYGEYGNGTTPQAAVENDWSLYADLPEDRAIRIDRHDEAKYYRWTGYMWTDVTDFFKALHSAAVAP